VQIRSLLPAHSGFGDVFELAQALLAQGDPGKAAVIGTSMVALASSQRHEAKACRKIRAMQQTPHRAAARRRCLRADPSPRFGSSLAAIKWRSAAASPSCSRSLVLAEPRQQTAPGRLLLVGQNAGIRRLRKVLRLRAKPARTVATTMHGPRGARPLFHCTPQTLAARKAGAVSHSVVAT